MTKEIQNELTRLLSEKFNLSSSIQNIESVSGGSINQAFSFEFSGSRFFCKTNSDFIRSDFFKIEAESLNFLRGKSSFCIPEVIIYGDTSNAVFLCLEYLEEKRSDLDWTRVGVFLAELHANKNNKFGFEYSNFMGSVPQVNSWESSFFEFFISQRLNPMLKLCFDNKLLSKNLLLKFESFFKEANSIFPEEPASLIHGDLWRGNLFFSSKGPCIIDPSLSYSHREMDLAMTFLFGGFDPEFYSAYESNFPLEKKWRGRMEWYNLYPLLIHLYLFGKSYETEIVKTISKF